MSLRARILLYVAAVMGMVFVMVIATLLPDTLRAPKARLETGREVAEALQVLFCNLTAKQRQDWLASKPPLAQGQSVLDGWLLADADGNVHAWQMAGEPLARISLEYEAKQNFDHKLPIQSPDSEHLVLYAHTNHAMESALDVWGIFLVMMLGTLLLALVIYQVLLRLVVKPVERLALAARTAAAKGLLLQVAHTERQDEIGELIRAYNAMAAEVNDLRANLEKRVHESTRSLEAAQNQIVISERLSAAGRMAAGVAHEVNNPLGGMLNAARSLKAKAAPGSRESEYLDLVLDGLSRIQHIMANLLQFSRPVQQASRVDLVEVLEGALLFCQYRFGKMNLTVTKDYERKPESSATSVMGHRAELGQVFLNLLVNALDTMEAKGAGPHTLALSVRRDGAEVKASVADTGAGMSDQELEQAGRFFYSTKGEGKGTGLGLAVAQHIVMQHNGSLKIVSAVGQGTTISIALPAAQN